MNKNLYRLVFNKARGIVMAVAETETACGKGDGGVVLNEGATSRPSQHRASFNIKQVSATLGIALGFISITAHAGVTVDPSAPSTQRPTVLNAGNGVPLVNIQPPSTAGVSRNTFTQFDVSTRGLILNNSHGNVQTQLGGWVQGNPWLATGEARVILNEVNASNPSLLQGYIEVAGGRAQVVIANPAGVSCDGCGFINANRVTLTTGTPILSGGSLDGYRVGGGIISIGGNGLDTKDAATTVATINRGVATGKDTTDALGKIFTDQTKQNINAGFEIVGAFSQQASTFLDNRAKESTAAQQALDAENAKPADQRNQDVINQATQVLQDNQIWAMGGTGRIALTTVTAAFSGNLTGSGTELVQSATIRTLQALGAQEIKQLADSLGGEGSAAHTALHAVLACAGAEATGSDCGTAALAASGGVIINTLLDQIDGKGSTNLTPAEKEARANLINTLITSTTAALGGDAATASVAARIETENNGLKELFFPPDLPKMPFYGYVKNQDKSFTLVEKFASIDREKSRIILIAPGDRVLSEDRALYAAGAGGDEVNGYTVIFAHATDKTIQGVRMTEPAMFNQFVDMIKNSGAWEPGKPIMIDACNAGRLDSGIASALAKALNTVVVAPTTQTWQFPIWSTSGMTGAFEPTEPNGDYPNIQAPGKWKTFGPNGSVISTSKYPPNAPFQK